MKAGRFRLDTCIISYVDSCKKIIKGKPYTILTLNGYDFIIDCGDRTHERLLEDFFNGKTFEGTFYIEPDVVEGCGKHIKFSLCFEGEWVKIVRIE